MAWKRMGVLMLVLAFGAACDEEMGTEPDVATVMLHFPGNDTVFFDVLSGMLTSGPIEIFDDVDFSVQFFTADGQVEGRVTDARFRLDVTPANTSIVTFLRGTSFSGSLVKVTNGSTTIDFGLYDLQAGANLVSFTAPIDVQ